MSNLIETMARPLQRQATAGGIQARRMLEGLLDLIGEWRKRTIERRELAQLNARDLRDLGLSPGDRLMEVHKPFWRP